MEKVNFTGHDWKKLAWQSRVYLYEKMERENTYWTPIGIYSSDAIEYLTDKKLIEPYVDDEVMSARFFTWTSLDAYWKWQQAKTAIYSKIKHDPDHVLNKVILFCDDHDYLSLLRTSSLPIDREASKTALHMIANACKDITESEERMRMVKMFKNAEERTRLIEEGKPIDEGNAELVEDVFDIHQ